MPELDYTFRWPRLVHDRAAPFGTVFRELKRWGMLLLSDAALPSVATLVAGEPVRGSWWAHPRSQVIFHVAEQLADHPEVLAAKLINHKVTFLERRLWGALFAVGASCESWQMAGLSPAARSLFRVVGDRGMVRLDSLAEEKRVLVRALGNASRELENRLLVFSESVHTQRGSHAKQLESWGHLARRRELGDSAVSTRPAQEMLNRAASALEEHFHVPAVLPWAPPPQTLAKRAGQR